MIDQGKKNLLGVNINALDYERAVSLIVDAAQAGKPCATTALAVHGVVTGALDPQHRTRLNSFALVTPDGQPVRWALNLLYKTGLTDRVYGPNLTLMVCRRAALEGLPVYFYGSRPEVLARLTVNLQRLCPGLRVAGAQPSRFRTLTPEEQARTAAEIGASGARLLFVGLGCPRQEVFVYEMTALLAMPMLAVGAAFDYYAGLLEEPPAWVQRAGLQWLYRLGQEPGRLWRRYLVTNTQYVVRVAAQALHLWTPSQRPAEPQPVRYG